MNITMTCGACRTAVRFAAEHAGKRAKCPQCGEPLVIGPAAAAPPSSPNKPPVASRSPAPAATAPAPARSKPSAAAIDLRPVVASPSARVSPKRKASPATMLLVCGGLAAVLVLGLIGAAAVYFLAPPNEPEQIVAQGTNLPPSGEPGESLPAPTPQPPPVEQPIAGPVAATDTTDTEPLPNDPPDEPANSPPEDQPENNPPPSDDPFDDPVAALPPELRNPPVGDDSDDPPTPRPSPTPPIGSDEPVQPERPIVKNPPVVKPPPPVSDDPLIGQVATLLYVVRGEQKKLEDVRIAAIDPGKEPSSVKGVQFRLATEAETKRARKLPIEQIVRIVVGDRQHDVRFERKTGVYTIVDALERRAQIGKQLAQQGNEYWPVLSSEEQAKYVEEHRKFITDVSKKFEGKLRIQESDYFIFASDLSPLEADQSLAYLTAMYTKLCAMFGVMPGDNIWRGKCVVVVFRQESDYFAFEQQIMENPNPEGTAGLHHGFRNGNTFITCQRGQDAAFYRAVLVHETVHGFIHRFQSSVRVPSWVNEGIADWISDVVVPDSKEVDMRRAQARRELARTRTLGDEFFQSQRITATQYGIASDLTDFMLQSDPAGYRFFLEGIKEGKPWEVSLQDSFGIEQEQLAALYFQNRVGR